MDTLAQTILTSVQPPWSYVVGLIAVFVVLLPAIEGVYRLFTDFRYGRRFLEVEKQRLELLKLRSEIVSSDTSYEELIQSVPLAFLPYSESMKHKRAFSLFWRWMRAYPALARRLLMFLNLLVVGLTALLVIATYWIFVRHFLPNFHHTLETPEGMPGLILAFEVLIVYAVLTLGSYICQRRLRDLRFEVERESQHHQP